MNGATYSLKSPDAYYRDVRKFTDEVILKSSITITPIAEDYIKYLRQYNLEQIREIEEYILELLSFGILWRAYAGRALAVKHAPFITLSKMSEWRKKHQRYKPAIDYSRGILFTLFLLPKKRIDISAGFPSLEDIDHVCKWFEATGEFREQALRFVRWRAYWAGLSGEELKIIFFTIRTFTTWFIERSAEVLGKYTENVEVFLQNSDTEIPLARGQDPMYPFKK